MTDVVSGTAQDADRAAAYRNAVADLARDAERDEGVTWTPSS